MIILDTSVLIRFFTGDDKVKANKVKALLDSENELLLIDTVLLELVYTLLKVYKQPKSRVMEILKFLLSRSNICISTEIKKSVKYYEELNLSITDCLLLSYGEGKRIACFDEGILKTKGVKSFWIKK